MKLVKNSFQLKQESNFRPCRGEGNSTKKFHTKRVRIRKAMDFSAVKPEVQ